MKYSSFFFMSILALSVQTNRTESTIDHKKEIANEYRHLAYHLEQLGNTKSAFVFYKKSIELDDSSALSHAKLGCLYYDDNSIPAAIDHLTKSLKLEPNNSHIHFNLGQCYLKQDEWRAAFTAFQKTVSLDPKHTCAYCQLGIVCEKLKLYSNAVDAYKNAIEIDPECFDAHHSFGNMLRHLEQTEQSLVHYRIAHRLQPNNLHVMMNLANALNILNYNQESLELYGEIVKKNPDAVSPLYNFGFTLKKMGHLDHARDIYLQLLVKKPDYAPAHFSLASLYLMLGNLEQGFQEYEWRWKAYNEEEHQYNRPQWRGEDIVGRTLLVHAEQGLGDTLQFIRYIKLLKEKHRHLYIIFESQDALIPLLRKQPFIDQIISRRDPMPYFHYHIPLLSLPHMLKTTLDTIPSDTPYIHVPDDLVNQWKQKMAADTNFKIGLCWQGNARYSTASLRRAVAAKSITLESFAPLFAIPGVSIYSLQQIDGVDQIETCSFKDQLLTFDASFDKAYGPFMDTAGVMKQFDLIISVDTATAHLGGALNVPTWIVLPYPADWRWMVDRNDSPWYSSIKLFRQKKAGEWQPVINQIADELYNRIHKNKKELEPPCTAQQPTEAQRLFFEQLINTVT